ncbi:MAG: hypothetical protein GSR80_000765 [Desulfurococcales archaeon]|nr:hypothetical protein [Desulfurococcales archaeon]
MGRTRRIIVEVEVPEELELGEEVESRLARAAVRAFLADLLAGEVGLSREEAIWLERRVKEGLARKRSS